MRWIAVLWGALLLGCATAEEPKEKIWVLVRKVELAGVDADRAKSLLATRVRVSPVEGGFVEPRRDLRVVEVEIAKLAGEDELGRRVNGPVIESSMRALRRALAASDLVGATVTFLRPDLEALRAGSGALVLRVELPEPPAEEPEEGEDAPDGEGEEPGESAGDDETPASISAVAKPDAESAPE